MEVRTQVAVPVIYKGVKLEVGYRLDIVVENKVIVETKTVTELLDIHKAQLLTYLRLTDLKLGLLINFNSVKVVDGLKRVVNNL